MKRDQTKQNESLAHKYLFKKDFYRSFLGEISCSHGFSSPSRPDSADFKSSVSDRRQKMTRSSGEIPLVYVRPDARPQIADAYDSDMQGLTKIHPDLRYVRDS